MRVGIIKGYTFVTFMQRIARRNKFKSCGGIKAALWIFVCFSLSEKILKFFPRLKDFIL